MIITRLLFSILGLVIFVGCTSSPEKPSPGISFSKDGNRINLLKTLVGHRGYIFYLDYSKDGKYLASGSADRSIRIWDAQKWNEVKVIQEDYHEIWGIPLCFSHNSKFIAAGIYNELKVYSVENDFNVTTAKEANKNGIQALSISPDDHYLVTAGADGELKVWSFPDLNNVGEIQAHRREIWSTHISPDGKTVITGGEDGYVKVWEFPSLKSISAIKYHQMPIEYVRYSHDGKYFLVASADSTVSIWKSGEYQRPYKLLKGHMGEVLVADFSLDDRFVFSGGSDKILYVFNVDTGEIVYQLKEHFSDIMAISMSPSGRQLATGSRDRTVHIWSIPE